MIKWIAEGSAKTYQLAKENTLHGLDPFNFSGTLGTERFLATLNSSKGPNLNGRGGHYPGSWTLPVCNASYWGLDWNFNYNVNITPEASDYNRDEHPPCICGKQKIMPSVTCILILCR